MDPVIDPSIALYDQVRWNLYSYCGGYPIGYVDTDGRSYLVYDQGFQTISLYSDAGVFLGSWNASNNAMSGYNPYPLETFDRTVPDNTLKPGDWGTPDSANGTYGWLEFSWPGNEGAGVHSGRVGMFDLLGHTSWQYWTHGCIRTTDETIKHIKLQDKIERVKYLKVQKSIIQPLPVPRALNLIFPPGVGSLDSGSGLYSCYYDFWNIDRVLDLSIPEGTVTIVSVTWRIAD